MMTLIFELRRGTLTRELLPDELSGYLVVSPKSVTINGREVLRENGGFWSVVDPNIDLDGPFTELHVYL